ncbi:vWA domain-containing protein [Corynebacterium sp. NPDC060344]|uniref:vWA domain-containing protein n=1 Tax=Corynebacterium sp. NPDC060344 TaxID=3347101 RepID=UPI003664E651
MGRHSDGKPNYRVAKAPLILLLVAILVGAMIIAWFALRATERGEAEAGGNCTKGDLTLVVGADPAVAGAVREQAAKWGDTNPVVRDYCVRPQVTVAGSQQVLDQIRVHGGDGAGADGAGAEGAAGGGVKPVLPAVWVPADDYFVDRAREAGVVGVDGESARFAPEPVGLTVASDRAADVEGKIWEDIAGADADLVVATPGGPDAVVSSVVTARLAPNSGAPELLDASERRLSAGGRLASEALLGQLAKGTAEGYGAVGATQAMVDNAANAGAEGLSFISPDGSPSLSAPMIAFTSGGPIDENYARAAAEFVEFAREDGGVDADAPDEGAASPLDGLAGEILPEIAARDTDPTAGAGLPGGADEDAAGGPDGGGDGDGSGDARGDGADDRGGAGDDAAATEPAGSTLLLLDTSEGMDLGAVRGALGPLLDRAIDGEGRRVALWNYSSPMSEGVTSPVRPNVQFGAGAKDRSAAILGQLGTGGEPWLWRSVGPAVDYAAEAWSPGVPNRVVLVTSGSDASNDDARAAVERITAAATTDRPVRVDVVVVGTGNGNGDNANGDAANSDGANRDDATYAELEKLATATGGSIRSAGANLSAALVRAMGL